MFKMKSSLIIDRNFDYNVWDEMQYKRFTRCKELEEYDYKDMRLLGVENIQKEMKEHRRDFSFWITISSKAYVQHITTGEIYCVRYKYRATFKSDGFEVIGADKVSVDNFEERKKTLRDSAMLKMREPGQIGFDMFLGRVSEDEEYEYIEYQYFNEFYDDIEDEEDDEF